MKKACRPCQMDRHIEFVPMKQGGRVKSQTRLEDRRRQQHEFRQHDLRALSVGYMLYSTVRQNTHPA